jgi:uncharacterized membrane protein (DUF485 family)
MQQQTHHHMTGRDWDRLASEPEFQALLKARRAFIIPATILCLALYLALPISISVAPDFMRAPMIGPLTRAIGCAIIVVFFSLLWLVAYLIVADRFDARAEEIAEKAHEEFAR